MAKDLSWEEACQAVLSAADGPLHYVEIAERIALQGLRKVGANPTAVVATTLSRVVKDDTSPIQRLGQGQYALKAHLNRVPEPVVPEGDSVEESETGALRAFGMFWSRDLVKWSGAPRLFGRQSLAASEVNFAEQVGVYLLHDRDRVIYVGRAADTLFSRIKAHTTDRLGGRWDRFSWFGLRAVKPDGTLAEPTAAWNHTVVIETLEALLIESLEPPLNRKRGDNFSGAEYLQKPDPTIEEDKKKRILAELLKGAGLDI